MSEIKQFYVGQKLSSRSVCDHNTFFTGTVVKRTAKTITVDMGHWGIKQRRIQVYDGRETVLPLGRYSMCPVFRA